MGELKNVDEILILHFDSIMKSWGDEVKEKIPASRKYQHRDLNDGLEVFVRKMIHVLKLPLSEHSRIFSSEESMAGSKIHGKNRALDPEYHIDDVVLEYRILSPICLKYVDLHARELLDQDRQNVIHIIDNELVFSTISFLFQREFKKEDVTDYILKESFGIEKVLAKVHQKIQDLEVEKSIRERFMLTLTHDLRNPLSAIKATAELIIRGSDNGELSVMNKTLASRIIEYINRSDRMIKDLLDASKIRADGGISINRKEFRLDKMITSSIQTFSSIYGERFQLVMNPSILVNWDEDSIRRVLENLLTNAVKYGSEQEKIKIEVLIGDPWVTISVNNKGPHIPTEEIKSLFVMFRQFQSENHRRKGWGLGLTLVKGITEAHGGKVRVESSPDSGITFFIDLPKSN
jgi:signal transduction histidine kinase